ncbi:unnamed protein product [Effrenium voratum]|uniref:Mitochondrial import inner membrane translocase subunit TIM50 n=1 Tax=Effrenium voratum TaxID=2562239 RepID=A0AA36J5W2_9DINO|nr:unnamed protein product [Effrenium voratum]
MRAHRHAPKHNFTRVVFLDVDGVLNSAAEHAAGSDYIPVGSGGLWLERNLLLRLRDLLHVGQAHVVVSSSWRREQAAIEALKIACAQVGIALWRFIGQTCEIRVGRTAASRRVAEIQAYLRCSAQRPNFAPRLGVQQWVALDDMDLASQCPQHLRKNMIRTDPHHGLQPEQVQAALQVFGLSENRWESPPQGKGIILDIDGTLIDTASHSPLQPAYSQEALAIYGRPHLQTFLDFCFENFAGVALWSTSDEEWCKLVVDKVLGPERSWCFQWCQQHCSEHLRDKEGEEIPVCKKLRKVWKSSTRRACGFHRKGCVIIEGSYRNCYFNRGNAVIVPSFDASSEASAEDEELLKLMRYLETEVLPLEDVRSHTCPR